MSRIRLHLALCAFILPIGLAVSAAAVSAAPTARVSASNPCTSRTVYDASGPHFVYYLLISQKGVGCGTRNAIEAKFESCRRVHGLGGRCSSKVLGFTCKEVGKRQAGAVPGAFNAKVSCSKGSGRFSYFYEQN